MRKYDNQLNMYCYLGSVTDEAILDRIFEDHSIDIIYHAAAYKHVPIVEENIIAGIKNNVFGTKLVAEFADRFDVSKFVLVSTIKLFVQPILWEQVNDFQSY